jgi:hypothetical protein
VTTVSARVLAIIVTFAGCTHTETQPPVTFTTCIAKSALPERGQAVDVDGDGTPDWIAQSDWDVEVYVRRGDCFQRAAKIKPGSVAFVHVIEREGPGMRDLSIDTWLFHGDRSRTRWRWTGQTYFAGPSETILGPRR